MPTVMLFVMKGYSVGGFLSHLVALIYFISSVDFSYIKQSLVEQDKVYFQDSLLRDYLVFGEEVKITLTICAD